MESRLKAVYARLKKKGLQGLIIFRRSNSTYLTGFSSSNAFYLVSPKGNTYFTDSRYIEAARKKLGRLAAIEEIGRDSFYESIARYTKSLRIRDLGFEENEVSYLAYRRLKKSLGNAVKLLPASGLIEEIRQVKNGPEIKKILRAVDITVCALRFIRGRIKGGVSELEIAGDLERFIRYRGACGSAFEIIVASGPNSAFPHHQPSRRKIRPGEPVLVDIGVDYEGYKSDLTRVFFSDKINILEKKVYNTVLQAQDLAIKAIREGIGVDEVDALCRKYIERSDYRTGVYRHGTGHGIGLDVHEMPSISNSSQTKLQAGMVVTIEPAVYLAGKFGIRLEDVVLVTKTGSEVLSGALDK